MFDPLYARKAKLLLRCLPEINKHACFALEGGTGSVLGKQCLTGLSESQVLEGA